MGSQPSSPADIARYGGEVWLDALVEHLGVSHGVGVKPVGHAFDVDFLRPLVLCCPALVPLRQEKPPAVDHSEARGHERRVVPAVLLHERVRLGHRGHEGGEGDARFPAAHAPLAELCELLRPVPPRQQLERHHGPHHVLDEEPNGEGGESAKQASNAGQ